MSQVEIVRDEQGNYKRVYLAREVLNPEPLLTLQQDLAEQFDFKPAKEFHLTVIHYGKPDKIFSSIRAANPGLSESNLQSEFNQMLAWHADLDDKNTHTQTEQIAVFGDKNNPVLVTRVKKSREIAETHQRTMDRFTSFLENCGVTDVSKFLRRNPDLKYLRHYRPHLTLGFLKNHQEIPSLNVAPINILLAPPQLANVKFCAQERNKNAALTLRPDDL